MAGSSCAHHVVGTRGQPEKLCDPDHKSHPACAFWFKFKRSKFALDPRKDSAKGSRPHRSYLHFLVVDSISFTWFHRVVLVPFALDFYYYLRREG
jgi:hypothetical protein